MRQLLVLVAVFLVISGCQEIDDLVVTLPLPIDEPGNYSGSYVVTLDDGETVSGRMSFTVIIQGVESDPDSLPAVGGSTSSSLVNVNTATLEELQILPGIGEVKAAAIILYRDEVDGFNSIEDLIEVSGIGEKTMDKLRSLITVG